MVDTGKKGVTNEELVEHFYDAIVEKLPNRTTTNFELEKIGKNLIGSGFGGVYSADEFVKMMKKPKLNNKCYVVNTQNSDQGGEHWLAFVDDESGLLAYDSYADPINEYNPLFKKLKFIEDRKDREQRYMNEKNPETNCGARAIASLLAYKLFGRDFFLLI